MDKLLFLGIDTSTKTAVLYARSIGIYSIITDIHPIDSNPVKKLADEIWDIDVKDLDRLEKACRECGVTGIYSGNNEFCLEYVRKLSLRLFHTYHVSDKCWETVNDKRLFKDECRKVGLYVPESYEMIPPFGREALEEMQFPIIVKPADSNASQGLTLCRYPEELTEAYRYALSVSESKKVVIEKYIGGDEFAACYVVIGGKYYQTGFTRTCTYDVQGFERVVCLLHSTESLRTRIYPAYMASANMKVIQLMKNLGFTDGYFFIQMKYFEGRFYFLEAATRLSGLGAWTKEKEMFGINGIEFTVDLTLHKDMADAERKIERWASCPLYPAAEYFPAMKAGSISRIDGIDQVKAMDGIDIILERFHKGDTVGFSNSMYQIPYYILLAAENERELMNKMTMINETLQIYDQEGKEMLQKYYPPVR